MSFDWKSIVKSIAPVIGTAIGGPFGGAAMAALSKGLLGKENATEEELSAAVVGATPEQLATLKKVDNDFKVQMRELGIKEDELVYKDKASAREMFKVNIWPQILLSAVFVFGYFIIMGLLISGSINIDKDVMVLVTAVIGVLTAGVTGILQFWFGSSLGSKEKTASITGNK